MKARALRNKSLGRGPVQARVLQGPKLPTNLVTGSLLSQPVLPELM